MSGATRQTAATKKLFESPNMYADIQFVVSGEEVIYTAPRGRLERTTAYNQRNGAALYPQDGHKPCCVWHAPTAVKKVVIKARL